MKVTSAITMHPAKHGEITVDIGNDGETVIIRQGENHQVWIPRADIAEFCRVLAEWEQSQ